VILATRRSKVRVTLSQQKQRERQITECHAHPIKAKVQLSTRSQQPGVRRRG
jgi:hypothetical protein